MRRPRIIFITGTDTGVGKTLLTSLLLTHLRARGIRALALKPFCSGSRADVTLLRSLLDGELTADELNPFYFPEPIAPLVAARKHRRRITLDQVLVYLETMLQRLVADPNVAIPSSRITHHASHIASARSHTLTLSRSTLLVEGAGGLLAPLAKDCTALDLICRLGCEVLVVASNKLGTINHTLLTIHALTHKATLAADSSRPMLHGPRSTRVVLMNCPAPDLSAVSNARLLSELLAPIPVFTLPFLGPYCRSSRAIRAHAPMLSRKLSAMLKAS